MASDLYSLLAQWETDSSLLEPANLRQRFEVLDHLDVSFAHADPQPSSLDFSGNAFHTRALALRSRLESANSAICASIRSRIQQGTRPAELLQHLRPDPSPRPGLGYDFRDELVSGILQLQVPEDTNSTREPEMVFYQPTPVRHILRLAAIAGLTQSDVLFDIGSGLGHVPLLISILTGTHCVGIEVNPTFVASARDCARSLGLDRVALIHQDARTADLSAGTLFYLYTPFTGALLRSVLDRLQIEAAARPIRIATLGPCTAIVASETWLSPSSEPDPEVISLFHSTRVRHFRDSRDADSSQSQYISGIPVRVSNP